MSSLAADGLPTFGNFQGTVETAWITPDREMRLLSPFTYIDPSGERWIAATGSLIDGASIPRLLWTLVGSPFTGDYRNASVIHDVACDERMRPWRLVHRMFYDACRCGGVGEDKAKLMFAAVYHFGPRWGQGLLETAPLPESLATFEPLRHYVESSNPSLAAIEAYSLAPAPRTAVGSRAVTLETREERSATDYLRVIGGTPRSTTVESTQDGVAAAERAAGGLQSAGGRDAHLDRLVRAFRRADQRYGRPDSIVASTRDMMIRRAERALSKLAGAKGDAQLDAEDKMGLEALVVLTGRPSILIRGGDLDVDLADPDISEWQGVIALARTRMRSTITSVGRIDLDGTHVGTGFMVAPTVVMTNRHVVQSLAFEQPVGGGRTEWSFVAGTPTIDFLCEYGSKASARFIIESVLFVGPTTIREEVDVHKLDLALLRVQARNENGDAPPPVLRLAKTAAVKARDEVYVVGYAARPNRLPLNNTARDQELLEALERIFRWRYSVKRLALGTIKMGPGEVPGDADGWAVTHDATTLAGNSGSCVVALDDTNQVVGLHFGGEYFQGNFAHVLSAVPQLHSPEMDPFELNWGQ